MVNNQRKIELVLEKHMKICLVCYTKKTHHSKQVCNLCIDTPLGKQITTK
jgi:hypothetical protein